MSWVLIMQSQYTKLLNFWAKTHCIDLKRAKDDTIERVQRNRKKETKKRFLEIKLSEEMRRLGFVLSKRTDI